MAEEVTKDGLVDTEWIPNRCPSHIVPTLQVPPYTDLNAGHIPNTHRKYPTRLVPTIKVPPNTDLMPVKYRIHTENTRLVSCPQQKHHPATDYIPVRYRRHTECIPNMPVSPCFVLFFRRRDTCSGEGGEGWPGIGGG